MPVLPVWNRSCRGGRACALQYVGLHPTRVVGAEKSLKRGGSLLGKTGASGNPAPAVSGRTNYKDGATWGAWCRLHLSLGSKWVLLGSR